VKHSFVTTWVVWHPSIHLDYLVMKNGDMLAFRNKSFDIVSVHELWCSFGRITSRGRQACNDRAMRHSCVSIQEQETKKEWVGTLLRNTTVYSRATEEIES